jgi:hypothetical protein
MNNSLLLHYDTLEEFHKEYYKGLFTQDHIIDDEKYFKELTQQGSPDTYGIDRYCAVLLKDGKKYLLKSDFVKVLPIKLKNQSLKYSSRGDVYYVIEDEDFVSVKIRAEKTMSFKELVDRLSSLSHGNPDHYKLLWLMEMSQMMGRAYYRISTPPGFGKDSTVDIAGVLLGNTHTIESNPTTAQLMKLTYSKHLGVNEVVGTPKAEWNRMQQYLLSVTAFKNKVTRRSLNMTNPNSGDTLDVSNHSITLMYNDVDCYPIGTEYFDSMASAPMKDRLPALRLYGVMKEDFNVLEGKDVNKIAVDNKKWYDEVIRAFHYYKNNLDSELHFYVTPSLKGYAERWVTNIGRLFKVFDLYSSTQEEFDSLCSVLFDAMKDYENMAHYPVALRNFAKKNKVKVVEYDENPTIHFLINKFSEAGHKDIASFLKVVEKAKTFTEKVLLLEAYVVPKVVKTGVDLSEW